MSSSSLKTRSSACVDTVFWIRSARSTWRTRPNMKQYEYSSISDITIYFEWFNGTDTNLSLPIFHRGLWARLPMLSPKWSLLNSMGQALCRKWREQWSHSSFPCSKNCCNRSKQEDRILIRLLLVLILKLVLVVQGPEKRSLRESGTRLGIWRV
jgi:hypothetical protein